MLLNFFYLSFNVLINMVLMKEEVAQRHQMDSGSLALLYFLLGFHGGRQGSGLDREQSLVEWGEIPFVRTSRPSVRPSVCPSVHPSVRVVWWK